MNGAAGEPRSSDLSGGFDAIVVGTGPGGATVALELARAGRNVLILERGGRAPVDGSPWRAFNELGMPGRSVLLAGRAMPVVRGITVGGSSIYYYGTAFDPPLEMLRGHGIDVAAETEEARDELGVTRLPAGSIGPLAGRIMQSARDLDIAWEPLPKFLRPDRFDGDRAMGFYAAPGYEAKWNGRMSVDAAVSQGATLVTGARVDWVTSRRGVATGVKYAKGDRAYEAAAPLVIVAAGGIGSPMILRASGLAGAGYDFFYDPLTTVFGTLDDLSSHQEIPMQAGRLYEDEGYVLTDMMVPRSLFAAMAITAGRPDRVAAHPRTLAIMVKIRDDLGGRLTKRGMIRKPLTAADREKLRAGTARAREILVNAGARHIFHSAYAAAHPGGTVKVGDMLNTDLQTEIDNLYVCDASAIPEAWGKPPTLTIVALAKRLAKHLAQKG